MRFLFLSKHRRTGGHSLLLLVCLWILTALSYKQPKILYLYAIEHFPPFDSRDHSSLICNTSFHPRFISPKKPRFYQWSKWIAVYPVSILFYDGILPCFRLFIYYWYRVRLLLQTLALGGENLIFIFHSRYASLFPYLEQSVLLLLPP